MRDAARREPCRDEGYGDHPDLGDDDRVPMVQGLVGADEVIGDLRSRRLHVAIDIPHRRRQHDDAGKPEQNRAARHTADGEPHAVRCLGNFRERARQQAEDDERHRPDEGQRRPEGTGTLHAANAVRGVEADKNARPAPAADRAREDDGEEVERTDRGTEPWDGELGGRQVSEAETPAPEEPGDEAENDEHAASAVAV